ncbi:hypothetical protein TRVA0_001S02080 [Trichomonascus vanleenenianus]|uniref:uncharacterized protein n=1 Tax=Trichomonascus vanleenenianus TaxID=2268995 RepID=UPI003ECB2B43
MFYTVRECFGCHLPRRPPHMAFAERLQPYHQTHVTLSTMQDYDPVPAYWHEPIDVYQDSARDCLQELDELYPRPDQREQNEQNVVDPLHFQMPFLRDEWLKTEGDVTKLFVTQFIYPIKLALEKSLPEGKHIFRKAQYYDSTTKSRFDFLWELVEGNPENPIKTTPLQIVDLKMAGTIFKNEFLSGAGADYSDYLKKRDNAEKSDERTLLLGNAALLSRQAQRYSNYCKDILFFDWKAMIIFNFNERVPTEDIVRGTYFREDERRYRSLENFRYIQLGSLNRRLQPHRHN